MTLAALQLAIVAGLSTEPYIVEHAATILAEDQGDIEAAVAEAVARMGLVAMVVTPEFTVTGRDGAVVTGTAAVRIVIYEEPIINRARPNYCTALALGEHILILSKSWTAASPVRIRQDPAGENGVTVEVGIDMSIIHDATE
jgi:hypothetical protein